jgi:hypothetical protein
MYTHTETRPQTNNRLLNALTRPEFESLSSHFDSVNLSRGEVLYLLAKSPCVESGCRILPLPWVTRHPCLA